VNTSANAPGDIWNLPNRITAARIVVALFLFAALHRQSYTIALVLFALAAGTDWLDGYLARSRNLVTQLGRILDPLADKVLICGTFIFLAAIPQSQVAAWIAVVVVARELIVTVVRSFLEQHGQDFSANMPGKLKMVLQCACVVASLLLLRDPTAAPAWLSPAVLTLAWAAAAMTLYSGAIYIAAAARVIPNL
jgi:CDP-diacylglycerol--glycerol-3-phosphate 3-phosphatidyltransferase